MQNDPLKLSIADIVSRVLDGDANAFEIILKRYSDLVLRIVTKRIPSNDVEETAQNVFIRVYQSLGTFKGKSRFSQWLASIAVRTCMDYWRKAYRLREIPMSSLTERHGEWLVDVLSAQSEASFYEKGKQDEARDILNWALGKLSANDRMVLELVYLEGLSGKEAAGILGWSVANVKVRSFRARNKLRKQLSGLMDRQQKEARQI